MLTKLIILHVKLKRQFPHLVSRIGLSEIHVNKSKFHQKFTKSRRIPINLEPIVTVELDRQQKKKTLKNYLAALTNNSFPRW